MITLFSLFCFLFCKIYVCRVEETLPGWSGWRKTSLKYYFSTSFIPYWGFIFEGGIWLKILQLVLLIGIILDTFIIYFNIASYTYNIDAVYLVMLVFIIWYYTLSTQYCYLNEYVIIIELTRISIENSKLNNIHIYVCFDFNCIMTMFSSWTLSFIQIFSVGY